MGDGMVRLSSKSHPESILGSLHQLRLQGQLNDITVHVYTQGEAEEFQAHQVMLAAASGYFNKILLSQDSNPGDSLYLNMHTTDFSKFLEFLYTGTVEVARDEIDGVREAALLLECEDLLEVCSKALEAGGTRGEKQESAEGTPSPSPPEAVPTTSAKKLLNRARHFVKSSGRYGSKRPRVSAAAGVGDQEAEGEEEGVGRRGTRRARGKVSAGALSKKIRKSSKELEETSSPGARRLPAWMLAKKMQEKESEAQAESQAEEGGEDSSLDLPVLDDNDDRDEEEVGEEEEDEEEEEEEEEEGMEENVPQEDPDDPLYLSLEEEKEAQTTSRRASKAQFECDKCQRTFHYERSYLKHISTYHGEKAEVIYKCETCQQTFANRGNLKIHEKHVHSDERLFACQVCTKTFKRKKDVIRHQRQVHEGGGKRHMCPACGKTLSSKTSLMLHERTHTGTKPYECTDCGAKFTQRSALKMHHRTHTGEKPFACDECDARFTQKHMLSYHKRSHTGEKPFMCEACGKSFASKEYLRHHSNIHTGSRPYKCEVCTRGFAQRNSLHQHMKIHTGERPYSCKDCEKQFTQLNALQRHQRIHTGEKPYMCGLCNRTFTDKSTVRRHTMTHDTDAPWKNYLVVLQGNMEDKKPKASPKAKAERSGDTKQQSKGMAGVAKAQTETTVMVPAEPMTLSADWASSGTIALVSHSALGGFTVIQTEVPPGTQIQPIMTADGTGASIISLDGSTISVPFSIPVSMAHSICPMSSSSSLSVPVSLAVPVSDAILASVSATPVMSSVSVLEAAVSRTIAAPPDSETTGVLEPDILTVVVTGDECVTEQGTAAVPDDEQHRTTEEESTEGSTEVVQEASAEGTV